MLFNPQTIALFCAACEPEANTFRRSYRIEDNVGKDGATPSGTKPGNTPG